MERSEKIDLLTTALAKAQSEMKSADKNANNPHFDKKYADLAGIIDAMRGPFGKHGLAFTQSPQPVGSTWHVITTIWLGDQFISAPTPILLRGTTSQDFGAALTYSRRQGLQTLAGIAADEDDDGNMASGRPKQPPRDQTQGGSSPKAPTGQRKGPIAPKAGSQPKPSENTQSPTNGPGTAISPPSEWKPGQEELTRLVKTANDNEWPKDSLTTYMAQRFKKTRLGEFTKEEYDLLVLTCRTKKYMQAADDLAQEKYDAAQVKAQSESGEPTDFEKEAAAMGPAVGGVV